MGRFCLNAARLGSIGPVIAEAVRLGGRDGVRDIGPGILEAGVHLGEGNSAALGEAMLAGLIISSGCRRESGISRVGVASQGIGW